jgi:hypothetical protein
MESDNSDGFDRRVSLSEKMMAASNLYKEKHKKHVAIREEGWGMVDLDDSHRRKSYDPPDVPSEHVSAKLNLGKGQSILDVFVTIFSVDLVGSVMEMMQDDSPQV